MKKIAISENKFEAFFLIIFAFCYFLFFLGIFWGHQINHEYPYGYLAGDNFMHLADTEHMREVGVVKYTLASNAGGNEDVLEPHPPFMYEISIMLSLLSGIQIHDSIFFSAFFASFMCSLVAYLTIRHFNRKIAIISLPMVLFTFTMPFIVALTWGMWMFWYGILFLSAGMLAVWYLDNKYFFIILGIFNAGTLLGHPSEYPYLLGFEAVYFALICIIKRKIIFEKLRKLVYSFLIGMALGALYFPIAYLVWGKIGQLQIRLGNIFTCPMINTGLPDAKINNLGLFLIFIVAGFVIFLILSLKDIISSKENKLIVPGSIALWFFLSSFGNCIGIVKRGVDIRRVWYIELMFFFGLTIYFILKYINKKEMMHVFVLSVVMLGVFSYQINTQVNETSGIMNPYDWKALMWIKNNPDMDKRDAVIYFYGDAISSQLGQVMNTHKNSLVIPPSEIVDGINKEMIKRETKVSVTNGYAYMMSKRSFFDYCFYNKYFKGDDNPCTVWSGKSVDTSLITIDLCQQKYYYFDKFSSQQPLTQYGIYMRQVMLNKTWIQEIYANELVSILKNNRPGEDCIG